MYRYDYIKRIPYYNQDKQALDYYNNALKISKEIDDIYWKGISLGSIGIIYQNIGEYSIANSPRFMSLNSPQQDFKIWKFNRKELFDLD